MTTRIKFSAEFKSKVVLESLKERESLESLSKKYELLPTQISAWKGEVLKSFAQVFSKEKASSSSNTVDTQILYAQIGVDYTPLIIA